MSKHTLGPWVVDRSGVTVRDTFPEGQPYRTIASCGPGWSEQNIPEAEANARLVAAAPELLQALKNCRDALIRYLPPETKLYEITDANHAIAKAEGK